MYIYRKQYNRQDRERQQSQTKKIVKIEYKDFARIAIRYIYIVISYQL